MRIFAIDPGNKLSAFCVIDGDNLRPIAFAKMANESLRKYIRQFAFDSEADRAAVEMITSYGKGVGASVFDTARWVGRYQECLTRRLLTPPALVTRSMEKNHLCGKSVARDSDIRAALINRFAQHDKKNGKGTSKHPDWFYGFADDVWQAYAVGLVYAETMMQYEV